MTSPHPLLLFPVFRKIVSNLKFPELLSVRQVCSEWKVEADHKLEQKYKNKIAVKLCHQNHLQQFINEISPTEGIQIATHYQLEGLNLNTDEAIHFFTRFGSHIKSLHLGFCDWKSATLRNILFKNLPNLSSLELSTGGKGNTNLNYCGHWLEPLMPMSFIFYYGGSLNPLAKLKELRIKGDFSKRTDLFYDVLKSSSNLEVIHLSKYDPSKEDDLFGTWCMEIVLSSCEFPLLTSLEVETTLIQSQVDSLTKKSYPYLKRLCIDLEVDAVENKRSIEKIVGHFPLLESLEFGVDNNNIPHSLVHGIILKFKHRNCWIAMHSGTVSKIVFPNHAHVLES